MSPEQILKMKADTAYRAGGVEGKKYDTNKPRMSLCPVSVSELQLACTQLELGLKPWDPTTNLVAQEYLLVAAWCLSRISAGYSETRSAVRGLIPVLEVLEFGAARYGDWNWQLVENAAERYTNAAWRHLLKASEEYEDEDSGLPHLAHLACNCLFLHAMRANK